MSAVQEFRKTGRETVFTGGQNLFVERVARTFYPQWSLKTFNL